MNVLVPIPGRDFAVYLLVNGLGGVVIAVIVSFFTTGTRMTLFALFLAILLTLLGTRVLFAAPTSVPAPAWPGLCSCGNVSRSK